MESDAALAELTTNGKDRDAVINSALLWLLKWERSERRWEEKIQKAREDAVRAGKSPDGAEDLIQIQRDADVFAW